MYFTVLEPTLSVVWHLLDSTLGGSMRLIDANWNQVMENQRMKDCLEGICFGENGYMNAGNYDKPEGQLGFRVFGKFERRNS